MSNTSNFLPICFLQKSLSHCVYFKSARKVYQDMGLKRKPFKMANSYNLFYGDLSSGFSMEPRAVSCGLTPETWGNRRWLWIPATSSGRSSACAGQHWRGRRSGWDGSVKRKRSQRTLGEDSQPASGGRQR